MYQLGVFSYSLEMNMENVKWVQTKEQLSYFKNFVCVKTTGLVYWEGWIKLDP